MTHAATVTIKFGESTKEVTFGLRADTVAALSQDLPPYPKDRRVEDLILATWAALRRLHAVKDLNG